MALPTKKFFGNFDLDELTAAIMAVKSNNELSEYNGKKQVKIGAAQWEDGNISIDVWVKGEKKSYKVGNLRVSKLDGGAAPTAAAVDAFKAQDDDLPF